MEPGSKTNIKGTIKFVLTALSALGITSLSPELIRQAKFDAPGLVRR